MISQPKSQQALNTIICFQRKTISPYEYIVYFSTAAIRIKLQPSLTHFGTELGMAGFELRGTFGEAYNDRVDRAGDGTHQNTRQYQTNHKSQSGYL